MPVYLDEDMVGTDPAEINYPHLLLCMGVTVLMGDGSLIGAHFTIPGTEQGLIAEMTQQINNNGSGMLHMYCVGNMAEHVVRHGNLDVHGKATALGFHGDAYTFDTGTIDPQDGTYVSIRTNGVHHKCGVYYKRNEKVTYTKGNGPQITKFIQGSYGRQDRVIQKASVTTGTGAIHKLHKATFLLQLKHHNIP